MDVKLYYIEGISRTDTPYFATKGSQATLAKQESYFDSKLVKTISLSYYPPHYENVIKIDTEDVSFNSNVNYLSFEYNDKTYYYFIDDIEYVSETIIRLYITMDVIQTYMFDIRISNGVIERKFIDRWNGNAINRNYLRENLSNGLVNKYSTYVELNKDANYYVIAKGQDRLFPDITRGTFESINEYNTKFNMSYDRIYSAPLLPSATLNWGSPSAQATLNAPALIRAAAGDSYIHDMYIIPFNPFNDITDNGDVLNASGDVIWYYNSNDYPISKYAFTTRNADNNVMRSKIYSVPVSFNFIKNIDTEILFDSQYCPVMLDENYIKFEFGSKNNNTTYPLYYLNNVQFYCRYFADILTGSRYYYIGGDQTDYIDRYKTMVVDGAAIGLEMYNNAWNNYVANNRARWLGPIVQAGKNMIEMIATQGLSGASKVGVVGSEMSANKTRLFEQIRNKKGQFTGKKRLTGSTATRTTSKIYGEIPGSDDNGLEGIKAGLATSIPVTLQVAEDSNKYFAPNVITQTGNFGDVYSRASIIYYAISKVNDYEQCAQYYHRNGYLVNEYVNAVDNLFEYVQNRYYFNIVKASVLDLHLANVIEDTNTLELISERLEAGVRLWRTDNVNTYKEIVIEHTFDTEVGQGTFGIIETVFVGNYVSNVIEVVDITEPIPVGVNFTILDSNIGITHTDVNVIYRADAVGRVTIRLKLRVVDATRIPKIGDFTYDNVELDYLS